jgi:hypothetical protein
MRKQQGSGLILLLLVLSLAITGSMLVLKLSPLYFDQYKAEELLIDFQESTSATKLADASILDLKDSLQSLFEAQQLSHLYEFVLIQDLGLYKRVTMEYERRVELVSNIDIIATFEFDIELSE